MYGAESFPRLSAALMDNQSDVFSAAFIDGAQEQLWQGTVRWG